ncbi:hypothetical protein OB236_15190 [Paenibacillus sp. WQ 127069]|uniref:Uncharacterized protein n=1 Tax=Paenibacillus baimaensis TaxID=2982185 RepID=A0ABT2UHD3_9BACL|nr:hypothetical protein [Paenibacillus sp. WQ 127069]MCU6793451.1 hypothetical protein [Paenibacillus sp. WQ 127069]
MDIRLRSNGGWVNQPVHQDKIRRKSKLQGTIQECYNGIRFPRKSFHSPFVSLRTFGQTFLHFAETIGKFGGTQHAKSMGAKLKPSERQHVVASHKTPVVWS